jgi:hypothetical protein
VRVVAITWPLVHVGLLQQGRRDAKGLFVVKQRHIASIGRIGGIAKKVLCFTWFLGNIART